MKRLSFLPVVLLAITAGPAAAATLSSYSAEGRASVTLLSASLAGTDKDALGLLTIELVEDGVDDFPTEASGNAAAASDFDADPETGLVSASVSGFAAEPIGDSVATSEGRLVGSYFNKSTSTLSLVFGYSIEAVADFPGPSAFAQANARAELSPEFGLPFMSEVNWFDQVTEASGTWLFNLAPKSTVFTIAFASAGGEASAFAPEVVPLPATLPLFGAGLAGLAAVARRRRSG